VKNIGLEEGRQKRTIKKTRRLKKGNRKKEKHENVELLFSDGKP